MNKYLTFLEAHPALVSLILIPAVASVVNALTRPRSPEEYSAMPPRLAAFLKLLRAVFPDPQKAVTAATQFVQGKVLSPDAKRASLNPPAIITEKKEEEK
jgi:hypothetical protein